MFDTSQYQKYYRDVHDVLAAPKNWILRYNYDEKYLTDGAIALVENSAAKRVPVLLVYTQMDVVYQRESGKSVVPAGQHKQVFLATRIGAMIAVVKKASRYNFDFAVNEYPNPGASDSFNGILAPLVAAKETPWDKWVTVSDRFNLFQSLRTGDAHTNWSRIVQELGKPTMQFKDDAFWKRDGPYEGNREIEPHVELVKSGGVINQARAYYAVGENRRMHFDLSSQTAGPVATSRPQYDMKASTSDEHAVRIVGEGIYELRHYTGVTVEYETGSAAPFRDKRAEMIFETAPDATWPAGAELKFLYRVQKDHVKSIVGMLLGLISAAGVIIGGSELLKYDVLNGLLIVLGATAAGFISVYLLTGKFQFKL